jgi:hypothetical protein
MGKRPNGRVFIVKINAKQLIEYKTLFINKNVIIEAPNKF